VVSEVVRDFGPTVVVVERTAAGVPLPSGVRSRVVVGTGTGADVEYEHVVAESPDDPVDAPIRHHDGSVPHRHATQL
jgi:hypothetical protein